MSTTRAGSMDVVVGDGVRTCLSGGAPTMTENTHTTNRQRPENGEDFRSSEGLRALLTRLHDAGPGAWEHDPTAAALMTHAAEKRSEERRVGKECRARWWRARRSREGGNE